MNEERKTIMSDDLRPELVEMGMEESQELINGMREGMSILKTDIETKADDGTIKELLRCAHTLKSVSWTIGFKGMAEIARRMEMFFKKAEKEGLAGTVDDISLICDGVEACDRLLNDKGNVEIENLLGRLDRVMENSKGG